MERQGLIVRIIERVFKDEGLGDVNGAQDQTGQWRIKSGSEMVVFEESQSRSIAWFVLALLV